MGFSKVTYLHCDGEFEGCETDGYEASSADMEVETIQEYKKIMKKSDWLFKKGNKAYCSVCRKKLKRGQP